MPSTPVRRVSPASRCGVLVVCLLSLLSLAGCQRTPERPVAGVAPEGAAIDIKATQALASERYADGDWAAAETQYVALAREIPQQADYWFRLGNIYARTDRPDLAVSAYREALVRDPQLSKAWFNMGVVQLRQAANSFHKMDVHVPEGDPSREQAEAAYAAILAILNEGGDEAAPPVSPAATSSEVDVDAAVE